MTHASWFVATIALCGGTSRRMGVPDKTALTFGSGTILDSALTGLPPGLVVCVGDPRPLRAATTNGDRRVVWTREDPVGGGPVAGIRAGLDAVRAEHEASDLRSGTTPLHRGEPLVAVIAGDQPFAGRAVPHLIDAWAVKTRPTTAPETGSLESAPAPDPTVDPAPDPAPDGVAVASPGSDRPALLLAVYRFQALDAAIGDETTDRGVYRTLRGLNIEVTDPAGFGMEHLVLDVDDPADLARAVALLGRVT